jgi:protein tyrosine phosphatase
MLEDFVRMLWEQQVEKVVMLTNLVEDGKQKCEKYWPEEGEIKVGEITIKLTTTQVFADYTIRRLQLKKDGKTGQDLVHFHFTSWPDKDIPNTTWGLVDFEQRVASYQSSKPIVVHCSAGVGRTGTFIALRNVMRQAEETGQMDFFQTVQRLRQDRINMVQTVDQYIFLHRAAQVAMLCIGTTVPAKDIQTRIIALESKMGTGQTKMEKEFKSICSVCEVKEEQWTFEENPYTVYVDSLSGVNSRKNRDHSILPKEMYRAKLLRERPDFGDYINAVLVPSFSKQNQQVLTQLPLPATVADFWRLVTQYQVNLIVAFDVDQTATDLTIADYLSPSDEMTSSLFKIKKATSSSATYWRQEELVVTIKTAVGKQSQLKTKHHVTHLTSTSTALNKRTILSVIQHIKSLQQGHGDGRTLYMCRNGATYSGLVCVLSLLLDRMNNDQCLTVPLVVGAIKAVRPEVIPSMDQYKLLYEVANLHSETMREYYNFGSLQN